MKIAIINKVISPKGGGAENYALDLIVQLCQAGHEVHAIAHRIESVPAVVHQHLIPMPQRGWRKILAFSRNVRLFLTQHSFDVVYTLTQTVPTDIYFLGGGVHSTWLKIRFPNPLLRWLRIAMNPSHWAQLLIEKQLFNTANCRMMISNSALIKQQIVDAKRFAAERILVIHNGVNVARFNPTLARTKRASLRAAWQLADTDVAICFAAHDFKRKGLATLIEAVGLLGAVGSAVHLIVLGRNHKQAAYLKLAADFGFELRMHFLGAVSDPEYYYGACDLFVLPSRYEPCSSVVLEAMACGLPAITTALNGACELIKPNETGFVVTDPFDSHTLAQHLRVLLDPEQRSLFGQRAAASMAQQTFEKVALATIRVMEQLTPASETGKIGGLMNQ